ncbi:MAG: hypothetical protein M3255_05270 [Pseudomonadota bacterium]|nr:hypothetical protein [Pseudomonadota bacterium]
MKGERHFAGIGWEARVEGQNVQHFMSESPWSGEAVRADSLRERLTWHLLQVRTTERGELCERFAACRVWTVHEGEAVEDWLVVREESDQPAVPTDGPRPAGSACR